MNNLPKHHGVGPP